ncbi:hypothetical protein [Luteolibacter marinus]|uniref:hypothetical protein n=1 Tax=Luteolibacter marinus TaxID=2776705 RepID=UPI001867731D|nr:hypothetical protein [Luteolibacter marinus]
MKTTTSPEKPKPGLFRSRWMNRLIQMVPEESAICEFDCNKTRCSNREWRTCKRRLASLRKDGPEA